MLPTVVETAAEPEDPPAVEREAASASPTQSEEDGIDDVLDLSTVEGDSGTVPLPAPVDPSAPSPGRRAEQELPSTPPPLEAEDLVSADAVRVLGDL